MTGDPAGHNLLLPTIWKTVHSGNSEQLLCNDKGRHLVEAPKITDESTPEEQEISFEVGNSMVAEAPNPTLMEWYWLSVILWDVYSAVAMYSVPWGDIQTTACIIH